MCRYSENLKQPNSETLLVLSISDKGHSTCNDTEAATDDLDSGFPKASTWGTLYAVPGMQLVLYKCQCVTEKLELFLESLQLGCSTFYANLNIKGSDVTQNLYRK